jgi:hypothetical protein
MLTPRSSHSFFERRLSTLLKGARIENYHEDYARNLISFYLIGPVSISHQTLNRIRELLNARVVTLTAAGNSFIVVAYGVIFVH